MNRHACLFVCFFAEVWDLGTKNGVVHCTKNQWKNAWKFSKTLGKMLGSFGSQIGSQHATDIGRNVPWTSQPTVLGELGRNLGWDFRNQPCNMSPIC